MLQSPMGSAKLGLSLLFPGLPLLLCDRVGCGGLNENGPVGSSVGLFGPQLVEVPVGLSVVVLEEVRHWEGL